jgi:membrane protein DedA with SNARE-associated domain
LLTGGALAGAGKLNFGGILIVAVLGCLLADMVWFEAGRLRGKRVLRLLCALTADPSYCIRRGRKVFAKKGLRLLLIAKFVPGLDGICPPLAGMLGTSRAAFLVHDAGGASLWAGVYIGCGFLFARQLDKVAQRISAGATAVVLIFGIPLLIFFVLKLAQLVLMIRLLRPLQIRPELLKSRLDSGGNFVSSTCCALRRILRVWPPFQERCASIRSKFDARSVSSSLVTSIWCSTADPGTVL